MQFLQIRDWTPVYINVCPAHITILVECQRCGSRRDFNRDAVPTSLQHALIADVEKRLKCSSCGSKSGKLLFGSYVGD